MSIYVNESRANKPASKKVKKDADKSVQRAK